jgi:hypothetical protein
MGAVLCLCAALMACGKMGEPSAPGPPGQVHWPKFYPTQ